MRPGIRAVRCGQPGENWRGVALVNAILDAGEIRCLPFVECAERIRRI